MSVNTTTPASVAALTHDGTLPVPGTWVIDPSHTEVSFTARHLMVAKVRGRFTAVTGAVTMAPDMSDSRVEAVIEIGSVDTGNHGRDEHLRSAELFDAERFPLATFSSLLVEWHGTHGVVHGDLTLHGITRQVPLHVTYEGPARDPWGGERAVFSASATLNREDFGISWNVPLETGGVVVGKDISIHIEMQTVRQP